MRAPGLFPASAPQPPASPDGVNARYRLRMRREWRRVGLAALAAASVYMGAVALSSAQTIYVEVGA